jgi:mannitol-1-/sugar-/sorbitol-6-phosphatase
VPGARRLLDRLPPERWAVVTSGSEALVRNRLRAAGLPVPHVLVCADDVNEGKPSLEGYAKAACALGFAPSDCLVCEDSPSGVAAGKAAGARVVAVLTTAARTDLNADVWIGDLREVALAPVPQDGGTRRGITLTVGGPDPR